MKTTLIATLTALALLAGCGKEESPELRSDARNNQLLDRNDPQEADRWAREAYALYGEAAVETCLRAFHRHPDYARPAGTAPGERLTYFDLLTGFMCDCARGQSEQPCPEP
jgi:hypothetical protein